MIISYGDWSSSFLEHYFPRLPEDIQNCIYELSTGNDLLNLYTRFRNAAVHSSLSSYYSQEILFIPWGSSSSFSRRMDNNKRMLPIIRNNDDVIQFINEFPKVIPNRLHIHCNNYGFSSMQDILDMYGDRIYQIKELEITLAGYILLTPNKFNYLLSFPNLTTLQLYSTRWEKRLVKNSIPINHPTLRKLEFSQFVYGVGNDNVDYYIDWSGFEFPQNLQELSLTGIANISTITIPETTTHLHFNCAKIGDIVSCKSMLENVTELSLRWCRLQVIDLDVLPAGLRILDLSYNRIGRIVGNYKSALPEDLHTLKLNMCTLDDVVLDHINENIGWPSQLTRLEISSNNFSKIDILEKLPETLKTLWLSRNHLKWDEGEVLFTFPHLTELCLHRCGICDLQNFQFPSSLKNLTLCFNEIENISSYQGWNNLVNLHTLSLCRFSRQNLNGWIVLPNLRELHLAYTENDQLNNKFGVSSENYNLQIITSGCRYCNRNT
ncbi:uncharacterized protein SPAPADRAFT_50783 [Spathaspora passalidarum NRRL Y-27907]|uniref:F-box domain-containing protein n=1 Tax=Spathaspora passalidarum (strain NRRL Y-27907 / 11-Y1) TaxID=619300 RepID=G3APN8_SPAPN|nr:uncharacterized protein SPAPADRAFT_50783 [Spathaspora passalidarum NRRL Y-27907]EGW32209.1 hypothetical protein SPAPADRAFT_50783 [Spathaspora passalidarum NRRL Y-27907]